MQGLCIESTRKAADIIYACKVSKTVSSQLYHIENSKTGGQRG